MTQTTRRGILHWTLWHKTKRRYEVTRRSPRQRVKLLGWAKDLDEARALVSADRSKLQQD